MQKGKTNKSNFKLKSPKIIQNQEILSINSAHFMPSSCQSTWPALWHYTSGRGHSRSKPANHFAERGNQQKCSCSQDVCYIDKQLKPTGLQTTPSQLSIKRHSQWRLKTSCTISIYTHIYTPTYTPTLAPVRTLCMKIKLTFLYCSNILIHHLLGHDNTMTFTES